MLAFNGINITRRFRLNTKMGIKRCKLCFKILGERGRPNKKGICSNCSNDCLNGQWGLIIKNIDRMFTKRKEFEKNAFKSGDTEKEAKKDEK